MSGTAGGAAAEGVAAATYVVGASGAPNVVVLPGLCVASYLRPACDALAEVGFRARLMEPPGWPGNRELQHRPAEVGDVARPVAEFLDRHGLQDVVLVGQSMGAQVAAHVAALRPGLVRHLVLQGPVFDPTCRTVPRALLRWAADMPREKVSLARQEIPEWLRAGPRRIGNMLRISLADRLEDTLTRVDCPTTVVMGEHDTLCGPVWAAGLAGRGRLVVLAGRPHSAAHHDPVGFADVVRASC